MIVILISYHFTYWSVQTLHTKKCIHDDGDDDDDDGGDDDMMIRLEEIFKAYFVFF